MEKAKILKLVVLLAFLMLVFADPPAPSEDYSTRPLCQSQFMLVNHACATIPFNPVPVPVPSTPEQPGRPLPPSPAHPDIYMHRHRNHRRHEKRDLYAESPAERECCRWLNTVDDECICDILVHLPTFLSRPVHEYTVTLTETCRVTFSCPSRVKI
ncbi:hypothetical protein Leryth_004715 [Lithospermum erythrorhizon]|nr:hypothetical protein Leryth_004715 [Lithospermum erythrorhizon]